MLQILFVCTLALPVAASGGFPQNPSRLLVKITKEREGSLIRFFIENLEPVDITATFDLGLVNLKSSTSFPCTFSCGPHQKLEVFTLSPLRSGQLWNYTLTNYFTLGSARAVHDDTYLYSLPYARGESFLVSQAFGGSFSHSGPEKYAIDWNMPVGTPVRAARPGVVVATRADSRSGGPDRRFENDANYILIQHRDGTIGNYAHLMPDGVSVRIGQRVQAGEIIGYSGNTGFSSGPHLHFSVFKASDGKTRTSIPIRFNLGNGTAATLAAGSYYKNEGAPLLSATVAPKRGGRGD